jgi:hypothetical protein
MISYCLTTKSCIVLDRWLLAIRECCCNFCYISSDIPQFMNNTIYMFIVLLSVSQMGTLKLKNRLLTLLIGGNCGMSREGVGLERRLFVVLFLAVQVCSLSGYIVLICNCTHTSHTGDAPANVGLQN